MTIPTYIRLMNATIILVIHCGLSN